MIAKEVYGADGVDFAPEAVAKAKKFEADPKYKRIRHHDGEDPPVLTADPTKKRHPQGLAASRPGLPGIRRRQVHLPGVRRIS